jgi:tetratricopeptide (TPR) repeat protein
MMSRYSESEIHSKISELSVIVEDEVQALNIQGYKLLQSEQVKKALDCFKKALELSPDNPVILNNLGNALQKLNRLNEAIEAYQRAIRSKPEYHKPYKNLALLYQLQGSTEKAVASYQRYIKLIPQDGEAYHNLGLLYMSKGLIPEAEAAFEVAAKYLHPENAEYTTHLGVGHFYRANLDRAVELFEQALDIDGSFIFARYHLGLAYLLSPPGSMRRSNYST